MIDDLRGKTPIEQARIILESDDSFEAAANMRSMWQKGTPQNYLFDEIQIIPKYQMFDIVVQNALEKSLNDQIYECKFFADINDKKRTRAQEDIHTSMNVASTQYKSILKNNDLKIRPICMDDNRTYNDPLLNSIVANHYVEGCRRYYSKTARMQSLCEISREIPQYITEMSSRNPFELVVPEVQTVMVGDKVMPIDYDHILEKWKHIR